MKDHSIHPPPPLMAGVQVMEPSCPLHGFWTMPLLPSLSSPTSPLHPLTATIHNPFRTFAALFYLSLFPVSNQRYLTVLSCVAKARYTRNLSRSDGWDAKGGESDGERCESSVNSIQRPLFSGAALRSNAIKGLCIITPLPVYFLSVAVARGQSDLYSSNDSQTAPS